MGKVNSVDNPFTQINREQMEYAHSIGVTEVSFPSPYVAVPHEMMESAAMKAMTQKYPSATTVLLYALKQLRFTKRRGNSPSWSMNNGTLKVTYSGLSSYLRTTNRVNNSIQALLEYGFIDRVRQGGLRHPSLYAISDRWKRYGTDRFDPCSDQAERDHARASRREERFQRLNDAGNQAIIAPPTVSSMESPPAPACSLPEAPNGIL